MGILNKDVCKIETNYSIKDTKTDTWGDGATEEEAWKDLEGHLYDHFWWLEEHEDTLIDEYKKQLATLRQRTGFNHLNKDMYVDRLLTKINELKSELDVMKNKA